MNYVDVCSGISAATCAWHPLGWRAQWFSEIDAFPRAVLAHHYPHVPNLGDMTRFKDWPDATFDVLVGGTPCQSFSVAGLRAGLDDPRGNLLLVYLAIARRYRPRWVVWENVPGVLSSDGGRDFAALLGGMAKLGYGFAYRILDAQYFGLAQRRRRVFVVGHLGDWRRAAAVLFERESLRGDPAPRRESRQGIAPTLSARTKSGGGLGTDFDLDGGLITSAFGGNNRSGSIDVAASLNAKSTQRLDFTVETLLVAHSLRADGFDASEDGTGRGTPLVPVVGFNRRQDPDAWRDQVGPLDTEYGGSQAVTVDMQQITSKANRSSVGGPVASTMAAVSRMYALEPTAVRRLTPRECERLQGFVDHYTAVTYRGKPAADGPRYKAIGNSIAVPVLRWIGERIRLVDQVTQNDFSTRGD